jgi:hypothetical protein
MKILVRVKSNTLLDIDDAEYLRKDDRTLNFLIKHAARCTVGSNALHKYCLAFNQNVIKSTSPVISHNQKKVNPLKTSPLHLVWAGDMGNGKLTSKSFSHKRSLFELLFPAIIEAKVPVKLSLYGVKNLNDVPEVEGYFEKSSHVQLHIPTDLDWEDDAWLYSEIKSMDFGLSPMVDHPFNQAKSAFKAKQYLSVGVPVLASAVGENDHFVDHLVNGYICRTVDDFTQAIKSGNDMSQSQYAQWSKRALDTRHLYSMSAYCAVLSGFLSPEKETQECGDLSSKSRLAELVK